MKIGLLVAFKKNVIEEIEKVHNLGFESCQLTAWDHSLFTDDYAEKILSALDKYKVKISTFWCGWPIAGIWDFYDGPHTLGFVPAEFRQMRVQALKNGSDFAKKLGVENVATHAGFLPEVPTTEEYRKIVNALRDIALYLKNNGQYFMFETGQETPVTLLRTIQDVGTDNLGVNLDPANLIMYGKANPVDALDTIGKYVRDVHGKDGLYPTDGRNLGKEVALGEGKVNYPALIAKLKEIGYDGPITIEREIGGEEQIKDINNARALLESLI